MTSDPDRHARDLAASGGPTDWFERLYAAADRGEAVVPWDRGGPNDLLRDWAPEGGGRRALVVGAGLGGDAEHLASLGYDTTAFDISPTAVRSARDRAPGSAVHYRTADLLDPPPDWHHAFDLVVESLTVQSLPITLHTQATAKVASFVAPGGTLLVIATARAATDPADGPPWPLTHGEVLTFATDSLVTHSVETRGGHWRAEFRRA